MLADLPGKRRAILLLVGAEVFAMALWFMSAAVLPDMISELGLTSSVGAALTSSISAGFVAGALLIAATGLADRFDPCRIFQLAAVGAGLANLAVVIPGLSESALVGLRFVTGFFLAGVYPVGMKIAVGWGQKDRGLLVGLVVGGLTLGTATPHLLSLLGGTDWRLATIAASILNFVACMLIQWVALGPYHERSTRFSTRAIRMAWSDRRIRLAFGGYFGHMWELYAYWAWISVALGVSYRAHLIGSEADALAKLTAFIAIAGGALLCPPAGYIADRIGKARTTIIILAISGGAALLTGLVFGGPVWLVFAAAVLWGMFVIPDSAQFSALIADYAPADVAGSVLTLQTALGFSLTVATVQFMPVVAQKLGWAPALALLAAGPVFGIVTMSGLLREGGRSGL